MGVRIKFIAEALLRIRNNDVNIKSSDSNNRNVNADISRSRDCLVPEFAHLLLDTSIF